MPTFLLGRPHPPVYKHTPVIFLVPCQVFLYIPHMEPPVLIPDIEDAVPLPSRATEVMPDLSREQEIAMRARTIKLISDLTGSPITPSEEDKDEAERLAQEMVDDPEKRIEYSKYPNETMAYLAGLVQQSNCALVEDLSELKLYVVNKLVYEVEHATSSKERIAALAKLGEVDGVDAFKRRSEMTLQVKPIEEIEKELLDTISSIRGRKPDANVIDVKPEPLKILENTA